MGAAHVEYAEYMREDEGPVGYIGVGGAHEGWVGHMRVGWGT